MPDLIWLGDELALEQYENFISPVIYRVQSVRVYGIREYLQTKSAFTCHILDDTPELIRDILRYKTLIARTIFWHHTSGRCASTPAMRLTFQGEYPGTQGVIIEWTPLQEDTHVSVVS